MRFGASIEKSGRKKNNSQKRIPRKSSIFTSVEVKLNYTLKTINTFDIKPESLDQPGFEIKGHKIPLMLKLRVWIDQVLNLYEHLYLLLGQEISRLPIQKPYQINVCKAGKRLSNRAS